MLAPEVNGSREIYYHETANTRPWWDVGQLLTGPIKFGKWDGVFVSIIINIFGAVLFLQGGVVVGVSGLLLSMVICFIIIWMGLAAGCSAIGICERTEMSSGGVYALLTRVLGGKVGASVGLIFAFGLCCTAALYATAFATAVLDIDQEEDPSGRWKVVGLAIGILILLLLINLAGVEWVIRFQIILAIILAIAAFDFLIGPAIKRDRQFGNQTLEVKFSEENVRDNSYPDWDELPSDAVPVLPVKVHEFFLIFGIFFPSITGVFAGVGMSGDLRNPAKDIPGGTIAAVLVTMVLYFLFFVWFACTLPREVLIASNSPGTLISASSFLFDIGVWLSSISGCASATYQAPRLIQSIAHDRAIRGLELFEVGVGSSNIPLRAIILCGLLALVFILIGNLKVISPIISIAFLFVYAVVEYANFALAKAYKIKQRREVLQQPNGPLRFSNLPQATENQSYVEPCSVNAQQEDQPVSLARSFGLSEPAVVPPAKPDITIDGQEAFVADGDQVYVRHSDQVNEADDAPIVENDTMETRILERGDIRKQPHSWYKILCAPTHSLIAASFSVIIMFLVNWIYSLLVFLTFILLVYYIHVTAPGLAPGLAVNFSFLDYINFKWRRLFNKNLKKDTFLIISPPTINSSGNVETVTSRGADYADRENIHQTSDVTTEEVITQWDQSHPYGNVVYQ